MIRSLIKLGLLLIVGVIVYNFFFGTSEEKEQSRQIFKQVGGVVSSVSQLVRTEREKFDAGKYDNALDKLGGAYRNLRSQAEFIDQKVLRRLDDLEQRKAALQQELDAIEKVDATPAATPAPPKKGIKADPKAAEQTAAKAADQKRRKEELQRRLDDLLKDSEQLLQDVEK
jgi:cytochrome c556